MGKNDKRQKKKNTYQKSAPCYNAYGICVVYTLCILCTYTNMREIDALHIYG